MDTQSPLTGREIFAQIQYFVWVTSVISALIFQMRMTPKNAIPFVRIVAYLAAPLVIWLVYTCGQLAGISERTRLISLAIHVALYSTMLGIVVMGKAGGFRRVPDRVQDLRR